MEWKQFFEGKRITLMGLGLLGRGVGDAAFLAECGADLLVTDVRDKKTLAPSLKKLKRYKDIRYMLGEHKLEDFRDRDFILKAAGVPLHSPYIAEARKQGIPVYMSTALFAKFALEAGAVVVGVTGTRGKSTVTQMIYHTLLEAKKPAQLGGNVRGMSTLAMLPAIKKENIYVLELDSWQLQGFGDLSISPNIAVFTNLKVDHLNYYPDEAAYFADKANIYKFQKAGDTFIAGKSLEKRLGSQIPSARGVIVRDASSVHWTLNVLGEHNRENAALAAEALRALGVSEADIKKGLESFQPVEGRLQFVRTVNGVDVYNDNNATTPDATIAALRALSPLKKGAPHSDARRAVLICGGADKGIHLKALADMLNDYPLLSAVILLAGTGTEKLKPLLKKKPLEAHSMQEAVKVALDSAEKDGVVLLSPGFASFGLFQNEYDRNDQFMRIVENL
ncbi:MAG: UDP-N-acetylmuramoyl-L-alanine--D-glutamate ligase [bacterium]|nr:UDP-N-acetylmuramoyl-L-alanine--D-glutamate ligase [bacterium]